MWTDFWPCFALVLCFFCCRFYYFYRQYENYYLSELEQSNKFKELYFNAKGDAEKFYLVQRCITALRHPHPETVEIASYVYWPERGREIYTSWGTPPPPSWRDYSCYRMYGDGRIIDYPRGLGEGTVIWPENKEHLEQLFSNNADILWLYYSNLSRLRQIANSLN